MKLTVVIPLFNKERYILGTLRSVLAQTHTNFEVLVIDDGSSDKGPEMVRSQIDDPRVKLIEQKNAGVSAARNNGIEQAATEWVALLDADDQWDSGHLEALATLIQRNPSAVAAASNYRGSAHYTDGYMRTVDLEGDVVRDYFHSCVVNGANLMFSSCVALKRSVIQEAGGFPIGVKYGEDVDTWARVAWSGPVVFTPTVHVTYTTDDDTSAMGAPAARRALYPDYVTTYEKWLSEGKIPDNLKRSSLEYANMSLIYYATLLFESGQRGKALGVLLKECRPTGPNRKSYLRALLKCATPTFLQNLGRPVVRALRRLRKR